MIITIHEYYQSSINSSGVLHARNLLSQAMAYPSKPLCRGNDNIKLQIWKYSPIISGSGSMDPINLSLLNIDSNLDPRVEEALVNLEDHVTNLLDELI